MSILLRFFSNRDKETLKAYWQKTRQTLKLKLLLQNPYVLGAFVVLTLLPLLLFFSMERFQKLARDESHFEQIRWRAEKLSKTLQSRTQFLNMYQNTDPHYLSRHVEKLIFLESEIETLKVIYGHPAFQSCSAVKERLNRLTTGDNHLIFCEKGREASPLVEEVYLSQERPVEVSGEDLKMILSQLEGVAIGNYKPPPIRPQIVIQSFDLKRDVLFGRECFFLEMDLIKREPLIRG